MLRCREEALSVVLNSGTILFVGPRGPWLQLVAPRGHSLILGPVRCIGRPRFQWMLSLEICFAA